MELKQFDEEEEEDLPDAAGAAWESMMQLDSIEDGDVVDDEVAAELDSGLELANEDFDSDEEDAPLDVDFNLQKFADDDSYEEAETNDRWRVHELLTVDETDETDDDFDSSTDGRLLELPALPDLDDEDPLA